MHAPASHPAAGPPAGSGPGKHPAFFRRLLLPAALACTAVPLAGYAVQAWLEPGLRLQGPAHPAALLLILLWWLPALGRLGLEAALLADPGLPAPRLARRLRRLPRLFWGLLALYGALATVAYYAGGVVAAGPGALVALGRTAAAQLGTAVLVASPLYLLMLDAAAALGARRGLRSAAVPLGGRLVVPALAVPVLGGLAPLALAGLEQGPPPLVLWLGSAVLVSLSAWVGLRSLRRSLSPLLRLAEGPPDPGALLRLRPAGADEAGRAVAALARLARRWVQGAPAPSGTPAPGGEAPGKGPAQASPQASPHASSQAPSQAAGRPPGGTAALAAEGAPGALLAVDGRGRVRYANRAARRLLGREALEGLALQELLPELEPGGLPEEGRELEVEARRPDGGRFPVLLRVGPLGGSMEGGSADGGRVLLLEDISERKRREADLAYRASHDALTGLLNRHYFLQELERLVARVARGGPGGALLYVDLDQLKFVNDTLGHAAGDRLIQEAARVLRDHTREGDLLARFGGDEFTVLLYNVDRRAALRVADNLRARFSEHRFLEGGNVYELTCSIGVALVGGPGEGAPEGGAEQAAAYLERAERACAKAKTLGRNQVVFLDAREEGGGEPGADAEEARWGERVRALLEQGRLRLLYQPIVAVGTGAVYDYEVLARLEDEGGRVISPGGFLPTVERLGLARELDHLVVRRAVDALASLRQAGHPVRFSVNLTAHALEDPELPGLLRELLQETGLDPAALTFEITETAAVADLPAATAFAQALKELGAQLALDHFGSGFGSFAYLQRLPVDKLKISGAYVQGLSQSVVNQSVVRSMNQVAHALGRSTVAAMVESREALALVRDLGVDFAEGYFLGPPSEELPRERFLDVTLH